MLGLFFLVIIAAVVMVIVGVGSSSTSSTANMGNLSQRVISFLPLVQKYATKYEIPEYTDLLLCVMMVESGGTGEEWTDVMCSSESGYNTKYPRSPGAITDPEYSIDVGVHTLADHLQIAKATGPDDMSGVSLATQGYNFGPGYIYWALRNYGSYSKENAVAFSEKMKAEMGWDTYGNPAYVDRLMSYYLPLLQGGGGGLFPDDSNTEFRWPLPGYDVSWITCWYGQDGHNGLDIAAPEGTSIVAADAGQVISAEYHYSWGNNVYIMHNDIYYTRYAHMVSFAVSAGQSVQRGQVVGYVGNTGNSFGNHLHFEVYYNGSRVDPYPYIS